MSCYHYYAIIYFASTVGHTGTYATGDLHINQRAVGASLLSNGESVNVESPGLKTRGGSIYL
ncbi:MAG: hypothetical protein V7K88_25995 [Nostoc sp.]|uniref:hypothetical protein n=1 Tax=Nostoc sp. TaxID=1180 RepID=UPI002FF60C25